MTTWRDRLQAEGTTPDPRFSLANERTFLAWIRTSLAMIAGGVGLEAFADESFPTAARVTLSIVLLVLGALLAGGSWKRWHDAEVALRRGEEMPVGRLSAVIATGLVAVSIGMVVVVLVRI